MIGSLNEDEVEQLLRSERVGRVGCAADGRVYVVPVTYVYESGCIYGQSGFGMKVTMMRSNPNVCFQVDRIINWADWQSVVAWGRYEELRGADAEAALEWLMRSDARFEDDGYDLQEQPSGRSFEHLTRQILHQGVIYRIRLSERTGRFEHSIPRAVTWPLKH
jgi:uncharacterized protein